MSTLPENHYTRINLKKYAVIPVWYGCNSSCSICMLSRVRGRMDTVDFVTFKKLISSLADDGRYESLILSGAEITTFPHLEEYVRHAASLTYFKKIQIQTNGRRLAEREYLDRLVHAGVNEFFISVHGQEQVHDAITKIPGSYAATMEGIRSLPAYPVNVITNTVLTRTNLEYLAGHFSSLSGEPVSEMHLWNFFPMSEDDLLDLTVSIPELTACFPGLISALSPSGKPLVLKGFPECLSPGPPVFSTSDFPLNIIQDDFWLEFGRNGFGFCMYKDVCAATECWGLSSAYRQKYGDEQQLLVPIRRETAGDRA